MTKLSETIENINKSADTEIARMGEDAQQNVEYVPTGIMPLDFAIGIGGLPKGKIIEVHGLQSTGKTSLCLTVIKAFQEKKIQCAFVDAEYSFNFDHAKSLGVDTDNLVLITPDSGEQAFEAMEKIIRDTDVGLIVVDSVSALLPRPEAEAEVGKPMMGIQARLMASGLRKIVGPAAKRGTVIIFINQLRMNIMGGQYDPYTLPGGMSLRFYASVMLELHRTKALVKGDDVIGYELAVRVKKNKVGKPGESCTLTYLFDGGFSGEADILDIGEKMGVIQHEGNTYSFEGTKLGIGANKARDFLVANPEITDKIKSLCYK